MSEGEKNFVDFGIEMDFVGIAEKGGKKILNKRDLVFIRNLFLIKFDVHRWVFFVFAR